MFTSSNPGPNPTPRRESNGGCLAARNHTRQRNSGELWKTTALTLTFTLTFRLTRWRRGAYPDHTWWRRVCHGEGTRRWRLQGHAIKVSSAHLAGRNNVAALWGWLNPKGLLCFQVQATNGEEKSQREGEDLVRPPPEYVAGTRRDKTVAAEL